MTSASEAVKRLKGESLQQKSLTQLKEDATDLGLSKDDVKAYGSLSYKQTWIDAINDTVGKLFDEPEDSPQFDDEGWMVEGECDDVPVVTSFDPEPVQFYELQQKEDESTVQPIKQRYEAEEVEDGNGNTRWFIYDHEANNWLDASTDDYIGYKTLEEATQRVEKVNRYPHHFCIGDRVRLLEIPKRGISWNPDYLAGIFEVAEDHFNGLLTLNWLDETGEQIRQISVGYDCIERAPSTSSLGVVNQQVKELCDRQTEPQQTTGDNSVQNQATVISPDPIKDWVNFLNEILETPIPRFIPKAIHYPKCEVYRVWDALRNTWDTEAYNTPDDAQKRVIQLSGMLAA